MYGYFSAKQKGKKTITNDETKVIKRLYSDNPIAQKMHGKIIRYNDIRKILPDRNDYLNKEDFTEEFKMIDERIKQFKQLVSDSKQLILDSNYSI